MISTRKKFRKAKSVTAHERDDRREINANAIRRSGKIPAGGRG